jgi:hypothetical protein
MREYIVERLKGHYRFGVVPVVGQVFNLSGQDEILSYGTARNDGPVLSCQFDHCSYQLLR